MGFASEYLSDRLLFDQFVLSEPSNDTSIIVVIPAFDEADIHLTLDSLASCTMPDCSVEVIIHVNAPPGATEFQLGNNNKIFDEIESRARNKILPYRLFVFNTGINKLKGWGAGLARKVLMDEAVRRFSTINNPEGIIVSLDADCEVSPNYLTNIYSQFYLQKKHSACSIYFEHPLKGDSFDSRVFKAITQYELHLRYYYQALKYAGFPEVFHTVGSAFAVRAAVYIKAGGMNRKQAGEDFYFIQKTIPMGGFFYLNTVTVMPSPRISGRVPFGTGPSVNELVKNPLQGMESYNPDAFINLRNLFLNAHSLFKAKDKDFDLVEELLPDSVRDFLLKEEWKERVIEINANTSSMEAFLKRFFNWFNMFKVVKFLNWSHSEGKFIKISVSDASLKLLGLMGLETDYIDESLLLDLFRKMER